MIKLAYCESPMIMGDFIHTYHENPLFFDNIRDMFIFIEEKTHIKSYMISISVSGGSDDRFKCEKDPDGFLAWRELITYDIEKRHDKIIAYVDLGEITKEDIERSTI